jgi:hypothetical protein
MLLKLVSLAIHYVIGFEESRVQVMELFISLESLNPRILDP